MQWMPSDRTVQCSTVVQRSSHTATWLQDSNRANMAWVAGYSVEEVSPRQRGMEWILQLKAGGKLIKPLWGAESHHGVALD